MGWVLPGTRVRVGVAVGGTGVGVAVGGSGVAVAVGAGVPVDVMTPRAWRSSVRV